MFPEQTLQKEVSGPYTFFSRNALTILFLCILVFVVVFSLSTLVTKPRLWTDEGTSIELARNFAFSGKLDVEIGPGKFTGIANLLQSTGYPVTVPLGLLFRGLGLDFSLARLYMIGWMLLAITAVYYLARKLFTPLHVVLAILLIVTFASFYGSGRTVVGEIPGFMFLALGLYYWLHRRSYELTGIFFGLALVTKPSVFGLAALALFLVLLKEPRHYVHRAFKLLLGMLPAIFFWFVFVGKNPFSGELWSEIGAFYKNPYSGDIFSHIFSNLANFFHSSTLVYFSLLLCALAYARIVIRTSETRYWYDFVFLYTALAFLYYLRSPGWLRYILIAELLILTTLPHALSLCHMAITEKYKLSFRKFNATAATVTVVAILAVAQLVQYFTGANIYESDSDLRVVSYINETFPKESIAVFDAVTIAALIPNEQRYQTLTDSVIPVSAFHSLFFNDSPLSLEPLPGVVVAQIGRQFSPADAAIIEKSYALNYEANHYNVYLRRNGF
ncbi:MAG: hypothetical protein UX89_C0001G0052 [Parcubacteria group bacterium GW2011_GWA2_47_16]|nr:MAG: hypothetical protein UX89_C0001G0052 [Parcubacteria group bacterium GW2011_GWA2_47_16]